MRIAVTGGTGFIGRYILKQLSGQGHTLRAWKRSSSNLTGLESLDVEWIDGHLEDPDSMSRLVEDCEAVVHSALWKPGERFQGEEGDLARFVSINVVGTLQLIEASRSAFVERFVFLSTCAVHDVILDDRPLDEAHPLWPKSHYGAHKAAIEKFVHSFAFGHGFDICALRPTGVYGLNVPARKSKWYSLIQDVAAGKPVEVSRGGKEVHASDVAKAVSLLLRSQDVQGHAFNCYDRYISEYEVATIARELSGSKSEIKGHHPSPAHQISTSRLQDKGMSFGGTELLRKTIQEILQSRAEV